MRSIRFNGQLACGVVETSDIVVSSMTASISAAGEALRVDPINLRVLDSSGSGGVVVDFSAAAPHWDAHFSLLQFPVEAFFRERSMGRDIATGSMDFSAKLTMRGSSIDDMTRTSAGNVSLRGTNLTLKGIDLDQEIERFESSQRLNLADVGAFFLAGPLGLLITKGIDFASVLMNSEGTSDIRVLVSEWDLESGVLRARDVAMATRRNRIAVQGSIDFGNERFDDVTVAVVDSNGCAMIQQTLSGPFDQPLVHKPNILRSLAGPVLQLLEKGESLLGSGSCTVFYSGAVPAPD